MCDLISKLDNDCFIVIKKLQGGSQSDDITVNKYICSNKENNELYVVKRMRYKKEIFLSLETHKRVINHPNISKLCGYKVDDDKKNITTIVEYYEGFGTLEEYKNLLDIKDIVIILKTLLSILKYIHSLHISHNDFTTSNIIYNTITKKVILIDWDFCSDFSETTCDVNYPDIVDQYDIFYMRSIIRMLITNLIYRLQEKFNKKIVWNKIKDIHTIIEKIENCKTCDDIDTHMRQVIEYEQSLYKDVPYQEILDNIISNPEIYYDVADNDTKGMFKEQSLKIISGEKIGNKQVAERILNHIKYF